MKIHFTGIFLTSDDAAKTADFYREVAGLELEEIKLGGYVYWKIDMNGVQLAIHDARSFSQYTHPADPASNLTHLYFHIAGQEQFRSHLAGLSIEPYSVDDVVIMVLDPDGRKVMFGTA